MDNNLIEYILEFRLEFENLSIATIIKLPDFSTIVSFVIPIRVQ